jgi:hypothetical protein
VKQTSKRVSRTKIDKRVVNVMEPSSEGSYVYEDLSVDENDFLLVQANDLDKESMHFEIAPEEKSVHWTVSAGHEPSADILIPKESETKLKMLKEKEPSLILALKRIDTKKKTTPKTHASAVSIDDIDFKLNQPELKADSERDRGILDN